MQLWQLKDKSTGCSNFWLCDFKSNRGADKSTHQQHKQCHAKPCCRTGPFINSFEWNNGRHHPWGLWGDCWFACEHSLDNEEPDWGTAISETFVIIPTGQSPTAGHPSHSRLTLNELRSEARPEITEDGIGVTWQPFTAAAHPPFKRQRRRDAEPQVPT